MIIRKTHDVVLTNDFHNTSVTLRVTDGKPLTKHQIRRAEKALCGVTGCTCSGTLGRRGPQPKGDIEIRLNYDARDVRGESYIPVRANNQVKE